MSNRGSFLLSLALVLPIVHCLLPDSGWGGKTVIQSSAQATCSVDGVQQEATGSCMVTCQAGVWNRVVVQVGDRQTTVESYQCVPKPRPNALSPAYWYSAVNVPLIVKGTNMYNSSLGIRCRFSDTVSSGRYLNSTTVECAWTSLLPGTYSLSLSFNRVDWTDALTFAVKLTPRIASVAPAGRVTPTTLSVAGANLVPGLVCAFATGARSNVMITDALSGKCAAQGDLGTAVSVTIQDSMAVQVSQSFVFTLLSMVAIINMHPSYVLTNSHVEVYGGKFAPGVTCVLNAMPVTTVIVSELQIRCSTAGLSEGLYTVSVQDSKSGTVVSTNSVSITVHRLSYVLSRAATQGLDTVLSANPPLPSSSALCKVGGHPSVPMTKSALGFVCPTVSDVGTMCVEISVNFGYDFSTDCQVTVQFHRLSRTISLSPNEVGVAGGTVIVAGVRFYTDSTYECRVTYPSAEVHNVAGVIQSVSQLRCDLPPSSVAGLAVLRVVQNSNTVLEPLSFTFVAYMTIETVSPARLQITGGTKVVVTGMDIPSQRECRFTGASGAVYQVPSLLSSPTLVTCLSPDLSSEGPTSVNLTFVEFDGSDSPNIEIPTVIFPSLLTLSPDFGFEDVETAVYITGSGFLNVPELSARLDRSQELVSVIYMSDSLLKMTVTVLKFNYFRFSQEKVSVTVNGVDFTDGLPFTVYPSPSLGLLSIAKGPWQGNYPLTIYGNGFRLPGECVFGDSVGQAIPMSYQSLLCVVPLADPGKYRVKVRVQGTEFIEKRVEFIFEGFTKYVLSPKSGPLSGGTKVTLTGDCSWIAPGDVIECSFADVKTPATYTNGAVACVSPAHSPSELVFLSLIVNNFSYSQVGLITEQFYYESDPQLFTASTLIFTSNGGTLVELSGGGYEWRSPWKCHFGDMMQQDLIVLSPVSAVCFSPHTVFGLSDSLQLSANQQHFVNLQGEFAVIEDLSIYAREPLVGPRAGGTVVTLHGNFLDNVVVCRFGKEVKVNATVVNSKEVMCTTPAWDFPATVEVEVSANAQMFTSSGLQFEFYDLPQLSFVHPQLVPATGGTLMHVLGAGFRSPAWCSFDTVMVECRMVSTQELECKAPATSAGVVTFTVTFNGQQFHKFDKATYTAYTDLSISSVLPHIGVAGTVVTLTGSGFMNTKALSCRFQGVDAPWVRFISSGSLKCEVPILPAGAATVSVSINGVDFVMFEAFTVHWELEVIDSVPYITSPFGGTIVTMRSVNWPSDVSLAQCRVALVVPKIHTSGYSGGFRDTFVEPAVITGTSLNCSSPPNANWGQSTAKVVVTSEQQTYSASGATLLYYEGSFDGFYRTNSDQVECSPGHFCRREKWYAMSSCEVGFWQPLARQRKCRTCLIGNYCPDRSMTTVVVCPSGKICPVRGLANPLMDCPAGYYCLPETSVTSFWDDSPSYLQPQLCVTLGFYCPAGTLNPSAGLKCTEGFYCPAASKNHYGIVPCISGYYCQESVVIPCPPRYFCSDRGNISPDPCPPGTYNPHPNQSKCLPCSYGYICPHSGMLVPQVCPIGYMCNKAGLTNPTQMCTAGYYCDGFVMTSYTSRPCRIITTLEALTVSFCAQDVMIKKSDPNNISAKMPLYSGQLEHMCCWNVTATSRLIYSIGLSTDSEAVFARIQEESQAQNITGMDLYRFLDSPLDSRELTPARTLTLSLIRPSDISNFNEYIEELLLMKQPQPCPPGMFCLKKTGSHSTDSRRLPPYECNPGTYCKLAASTPQGTGLCPAGYYCPAGTSEPIRTEQGFRASFQGNVNPAPCMPGFFSNQEMSSECLSCPSGYECSSSGTVWPSICPPGTYRTSGSMSRCAPCPTRSWTFEKGVTALPFCLPCTSGRLCSQPGIRAVSQTYPCIEGDLCEEAASLKARDGCPAGFLCPMDTSPLEAYNNECIEGFFCKYRTPMRNKYLLQCPAFSYCPPASPEYQVFYETNVANFAGPFPPFMCPIGTGADGKSGKKQLFDCEKNAEYTHDNIQRSYVIEVNPVNDTFGTQPTGFLVADNDTFPVSLPYYSMNPFDLALITIDFRHLNLAGGMLQYGVDWSLAITVSTDNLTARMSAEPVDMPLNFLNETVAKNAVLEFSLQAWSQVTLTVTVLIFNGLVMTMREMFLSTASVEIFSPNRANYGTSDVFTAYIPAANALPVNIPSDVSTKIPNFLLSFAQSPRRYAEKATPLVEGKNLFTPNSLFWQGGDMYMTTYLPYFSNCKGYGAYIPIWALFELRSECNLVAPENTTYIGSFAFGSKPSADSCQNITFECIYDEIPNNQEPLPRWFELPYLSEVFYISESPVSPDNFANGVGGNPVAFTVGNIVAGTGLPRTITLDIRYQQLDTNTKKIITALITFSDYQEITASQNMGEEIIKYNLIVNFSALTHTELMILFQFPLSFYTVLNLIIGFAMVGCTATFLCYHRTFTRAKPVPKVKFWGYIVMTIPPLLTGIGLGILPVYTVLLFVSIFVQGNVWTDILQYPDTDAVGKTKMGIFDWISPSYDLLDVSDMTMYRNCRVGVSLLIVALYCLGVSSIMFLPYSSRQRSSLYQEDPKGNVLHSVYWRRFSFILISSFTTLGCLVLVFFSYSDYFAKNVYPCVVALQVMGWVFEEALEAIIESALMKAPIMAAVAVTQGLCTFGAANFIDFLQAGFVDYTIMLYNRVYNEEIVKTVSDGIQRGYKKLKRKLTIKNIFQSEKTLPGDSLPLPQSSDRSAPFPERPTGVEDDSGSVMSVEDSDSLSYYTIEEVMESPHPDLPQQLVLEQNVEPILDAFGGYAADTIGCVYNIIIITFLWYFYDATQIAATYGIDPTAIPLYFLQAVMMVPFQLAMDTILHNCNEYFNGWAIHDFLDHLSLRFKSRTHRWAVLDTQNTDYMEEEMRTLYLSCFSSQFYFMCTVHCTGMILLLLGVHTLIVNDTYNIFQDRALFAVVPLVAILCGIVHITAYYFGLALRLWRIPTQDLSVSIDTGEQSFSEMVERFMNNRKQRPARIVPSIPNWTQVDLLKAGDEVIERELKSERLKDPNVRKMFLAENRLWLQENIENILTTKNLKKHHAQLIGNFKDIFGTLSRDPSPRSYSDRSSQTDAGEIAPSTAAVLQYWIKRAQIIYKLRCQTHGLILSQLQTRCMYCGSFSTLQSELIESIEDLFFRFKKQQRVRYRFRADEWDVGEWLAFVETNGHFRTLCLKCLESCDDFNIQAAKHRTRPDAKYKRPRAVNFADAPRELTQEFPMHFIVKFWLYSARVRLRG